MNPYFMRQQVHCLSDPVVPSMMWGSGFTVLHVAQGGHFTPQLLAMNVGFLYAYQALQCPMVALDPRGRPSLLHNALAGGTLGYVGVGQGLVGVPFGHMLPSAMYRLRPAQAGALVYGAMTGVLGALSGKPV